MLILATLLISSILYPSLMAEVSTDRGNGTNDGYTAAGSDESSLPKGISDLNISVGNETYYNTSNIWIELEPHQNKIMDVYFKTDPVRLYSENLSINLSSLLPPEASNIEVYRGEDLLARYSNVTNITFRLENIGKRFVAYQDSCMTYHNITLYIPLDQDEEVVRGDGEFRLRGDRIEWYIPELGKAEIIIEKKIRCLQEDAEIGKPVRWSMEVGDYRITYLTPPPYMERVKRDYENLWMKRIYISSNSSIAYRNVRVRISFPEVRYPSQVSFTGNNYRILDTDGNGLLDTLEWIVLKLREESAELKVDKGKVTHANPFTDLVRFDDGGSRAIIYPDYVNYYDDTIGRYLPIDTKIEPKEVDGFEFINERNIVKSYFGKNASNLFRIGDVSLSFKLINQTFSSKRTNATIILDNNTITYVDLFDNIDVRYRILPGKVIEEFVLKKPLQVEEIVEILEVSRDCDYQILGDGSIVFTDNGKVLFVIPPPLMWEDNNRSVISGDLYYEICRLDGRRFYVKKIIKESGKEWLKDRDYPVVIDSSFSTSDPTEDGYIEYDKSTTTYTRYNSENYLRVGVKVEGLQGYG